MHSERLCYLSEHWKRICWILNDMLDNDSGEYNLCSQENYWEGNKQETYKQVNIEYVRWNVFYGGKYSILKGSSWAEGIIFVFRKVVKEDFNTKGIFGHVYKIFGGKFCCRNSKCNCLETEALHWCHFCFFNYYILFIDG